jgi:TPR repeat protein
MGDFASMLRWYTGEADEHQAYAAIQQGEYEQARCLLEPLAARGSVYSLVTLGLLYEFDYLGSPDLKSATLYYERAADLGSTEAHYHLGRILVEQGDEPSALNSFTQGAESGSVSCMYWTALLVRRANERSDEEQGAAWLKRAAEQGHFYAKRDLLRHTMRNSQSAAGKVSAWLRYIMLSLNVVRRLGTTLTLNFCASSRESAFHPLRTFSAQLEE